MDVPLHAKAVIRYILYPHSPMFNLDDLKWTTSRQPLVVYRGQCNVSSKNIPRLGNNPLEISTAYGKPISTSLVLNQHIEQFACAQPGGRIFRIHVTPGVKYAFLSNSIQGFDINRDEVFQFLKDELPLGHYFKTRSLDQMRAAFFSRLKKEREVVLDPRGIAFTTESESPELWNGPSVESVLVEVDSRGKPIGSTRRVDTYKTYVVPTKEGRGRSLRTHSTRRNKNGRRFTRKPKGSRHGRH